MNFDVNGKTVLVTGGAGFIGQRLSRSLVSHGASVRILDNFGPQTHSSDSLPDDLAVSVEVVKGDVRNSELLRRALTGVDTVVHLAAETGTGQSMYEIERYFSVNVQGTATLLELLQNDECGKGVKNLVVASSRAVYGEGAYECPTHAVVFPEQRKRADMEAGGFEPVCPICARQVLLRPTHESTPFNPTSVYGLTKQVQEQAVLMLGKTRNINAFGLRYQNVYGPGQSLKNPYTGILAVFSNLARQRRDIEVYEDGLETRDFVYIDDVVSATMGCIGFRGTFVGALNIGSGQGTSVLQVARQINKFFNSDGEIRISGAFRMGDIRHNLADIGRAEQTIGYRPTVDFETGLNRFLEWANTQGVEDGDAYRRSVHELAAKGLMGEARST